MAVMAVEAVPVAAEAAGVGAAGAAGAGAGEAAGASRAASSSKGKQAAEAAGGFTPPPQQKASKPKEPKKGSKPKMPGVVSWAWSGNRKLLTAQFLVCVVVLGLGTLLAPSGSKNGMPRALVKGSALCGVFLVLSLLTTGGKGPAKAATAVGTLITAAYVLTSSDVHNVVSWLNAFFSKDGDVSTSGTGKGDQSKAPDLPGSEADENDSGTGAGSVFV